MRATRPAVPALLAVLVTGASAGQIHTIDGSLPEGGDCPLYGSWDAASHTCTLLDAHVQPGRLLRIEQATVEVDGTLTNDGQVDNRGTLVVNGFFDNRNDFVNFWDGEMIVRGSFFSHFMYNFGRLTNETTGSIEFELHLENNAPLTNLGHIDIAGTFINIPQQTIDNFGSIAIAPTGAVTNSGRLLHVGFIDNAGTLTNDGELIRHCESVFVGNPIEGLAPTAAQSLHVEPGAVTWCPIEDAPDYDVVAGDLGLLRATAGDFAAATTGCLGDDTGAFFVALSSEPRSGQGSWFLVRANGVAGADYDSVFASQLGTRDEEIASAATACP